MLLNLLHKLKC